MKLKAILENVLITSMVISFMAGALLFSLGMYISRNVVYLLENYMEPAVKRSNLTKTFVARYGSIVPNKDYIPAELDLGPWITWLPHKVVDMGLAVMLFSIVGAYLAKNWKVNYVYLFVAVLATAVIGQFIFIWNLTDARSELHRRLRSKLLRMVHSHYQFGAQTHDPFTFLLNSVMLMGECCGVNGYHDFSHTRHSFVHTGDNNITHNATVVFPLACCQRYYIERGFHKTLDCALSWSPQSINRRGCYQTMMAYIAEKFGPSLLWIYLGITYVELVQLLAALCLSRVVKEEEDRRKVAEQMNLTSMIMLSQEQAMNAPVVISRPPVAETII